MKSKAASQPTKPGAQPRETAGKAMKRDVNFKQSRDVREDRGIRQSKTTGPGGPGHGK
ncbi:MAG: hypothetical protein K8R23_01450 [Chthoniobacter sp.]|nr:hypothetical protein [Chthoniobacter sp.]